jgi:autoinducer 2-degrading protein
MFIVHVHVKVRPEFVDDFIEATIENAESSVREPGIARFDVIQDLEDATQFVLVEVYRSPDDPAKHKETAHYNIWREAVARMMAQSRESVKYANIFPDVEGWG